MSPRKRLYFNVGSLSCCSRSIYGRCCVWQAIKVIHLESTILYPCRHHALQLTICHAHLGPLQAYILIHLSLSNWAIQHTVINNELADRYFHVGYLSWVIYLCSALCTLKPKKNSKKPRFFFQPWPCTLRDRIPAVPKHETTQFRNRKCRATRLVNFRF